MPAKTILIIGTGSLLNYGCEAIVQGTYIILKSICQNFELYVASDDKQYDKQFLPSDIHLINYKRRFTLYRLWRGVLRRIFHIGNGSPVLMNRWIGRRFDIVLSCGGDNYCQAPDGSLYHILTDLMTIGENAVKARRKYVIWGASVGPFSGNNESKVIDNLRLCDLICVRESLSYNYIKPFSFGDKLQLVSDPAFLMLPDKDIEWEKQNGIIYVGLNLSLLSISHSVRGNDVCTFITQMFNQLDTILENNSNIHFVCIPHVEIKGEEVQNDLIFMNHYLRHTHFPERVTMLPADIGAKKTKGYISKMDLLIASRMHCCVGGISTAVPTLFLTYSNKGTGMSFYAYQHHRYETPVERMTTDAFIDLVETMIKDKDSIKQYLNQQQKRFQSDAYKAGTYLQELLS